MVVIAEIPSAQIKGERVKVPQPSILECLSIRGLVKVGNYEERYRAGAVRRVAHHVFALETPCYEHEALISFRDAIERKMQERVTTTAEQDENQNPNYLAIQYVALRGIDPKEFSLDGHKKEPSQRSSFSMAYIFPDQTLAHLAILQRTQNFRELTEILKARRSPPYDWVKGRDELSEMQIEVRRIMYGLRSLQREIPAKLVEELKSAADINLTSEQQGLWRERIYTDAASKIGQKADY